MVGYTRRDLRDGRIDWKAMHAARVAGLRRPRRSRSWWPTASTTPTRRSTSARTARGWRSWSGLAFLEGSDTDGVSFVLDITERTELQREREALLASERAARRDAEAATRRLEVVADASARLMAELDPEEVVRQLADVVVPELADVASIFVPVGDLLHRALTVARDRAGAGRRWSAGGSRSRSAPTRRPRSASAPAAPSGCPTWPSGAPAPASSQTEYVAGGPGDEAHRWRGDPDEGRAGGPRRVDPLGHRRPRRP